jgi:hypothetical protein
MVRPSPVRAKENELPRAPSVIKKEGRPSLANKRVSFGHVELHTFLKDADRTPSPMPQHLHASPRALEQEEGHAVAMVLHASVLAPANGALVTPARDASADSVPQLSDLLRDDDTLARGTADDDDDDDVIFQPRGGGGAEGVPMEFTQSYGPGIRELRADPQASPVQDPTVPMDFTRSYGKGILSASGAEPADDDDEPMPPAPSPDAPSVPIRAATPEPLLAPPAAPSLSYDRYLEVHGASKRPPARRARRRPGPGGGGRD